MADQTDTTATETSTTTDSPAATGGTNDAGATQESAQVDTSGQGDDASLLGSATADTGTGDDKGGTGKTETAAPAKDDAAGVPEAYELKAFTVGEGDAATEVQIDSGLLETVTPGLKDAGVTQEQLDKLAPLVPAIQEATLKQMNDEFSATRAAWAKQAQDDPEIGGKNFTDTVRLAAAALDHFGARSEIKDGKETNEFRKLLNESGLGNHPVMLRMFRDIGASLGEDGTFVRATAVAEPPKTRAEILYPDDQPKS
jgi:hypothetical protein